MSDREAGEVYIWLLGLRIPTVVHATALPPEFFLLMCVWIQSKHCSFVCPKSWSVYYTGHSKIRYVFDNPLSVPSSLHILLT